MFIMSLLFSLTKNLTPRIPKAGAVMSTSAKFMKKKLNFSNKIRIFKQARVTPALCKIREGSFIVIIRRLFFY